MQTDLCDFASGGLIPFAHPEAFTEPEKLLAAYFSSSTVGLCILDSELRYLAINSTLAAMNGIPAADHIGKTVREVMVNAAGVVESEVRRVFSTGEPVANLALSVVLPTRTEAGHWIEHFFPIKDESGTVKRIAVVVVETTEQNGPACRSLFRSNREWPCRGTAPAKPPRGALAGSDDALCHRMPRDRLVAAAYFRFQSAARRIVAQQSPDHRQ